MEQNAANELIKLYAKQLRLPSFNKYAKVVQQLEPSESYADFLLKLMKTELDDRQQTAQEKRIKTAKFPIIKRLYPKICVNHKRALSEISKLREHFDESRVYS